MCTEYFSSSLQRVGSSREFEGQMIGARGKFKDLRKEQRHETPNMSSNDLKYIQISIKDRGAYQMRVGSRIQLQLMLQFLQMF